MTVIKTDSCRISTWCNRPSLELVCGGAASRYWDIWHRRKTLHSKVLPEAAGGMILPLFMYLLTSVVIARKLLKAGRGGNAAQTPPEIKPQRLR